MRLKDLRILVVDEKVQTRRQIDFMLRQLGVAGVLEAASAIDGIDLLKDETPDLAMVGRVPDAGDCIALTRFIRSEVDRTLPIVVISGFADLWRLAEAKRAGATGFLVRPFATRSLVKCLESAMAAQPAAMTGKRKAVGSVLG